jgi:two-component system, NarL family, nitrate/nitrite response regulator NarL
MIIQLELGQVMSEKPVDYRWMEDNKTTSVVLADDHESVRRGIRGLLDKAPDIVIVGEAIDGKDALRTVKELEPDVLLLDIEMPGMNGIDVARKLKQNGGKGVKILVLSAYDDQEYISEVLANGASGYIIKGEAPKWIVEAVRGVARGEKGWVSPRVAQKIRAMKKVRDDEMILTYREIEILRLIAQGYSIPDIRKQLDIDPELMEKQVKTLIKKLRVSTNEEAVAVAASEGWI